MDYQLTEVEKEFESNDYAEKIINKISLNNLNVTKSDFHGAFIKGIEFAETFYLDKYDWKPISELKESDFPIITKTETPYYILCESI
jgi:hypothetical protein